MGLLLRPSDPEKCCLCGSSKNLTGEHKIKHSALRDEFGNVPLYIGEYDGPDGRLRPVQGPKSKQFHFKARLCQECNGARTQQADRSFDQYHKLVRASIENEAVNQWVDGIFQHTDFHPETEQSQFLFRYFSKILCCRLGECDGPVPVTIAKHAISEFDQNRVCLQVRQDPLQKMLLEKFGSWSYAAHGGLIVLMDATGQTPIGFHSSITIGPVQYIFSFYMNYLEKLELKLLYPEFYEFCKNARQIRPVREEEFGRLGF